MATRPRRSPSRRATAAATATYRGVRSTPRDLLVFYCNPKKAQLPGLDCEAHSCQEAYPRSADVRLKRNLDPEELRLELLARPPRAFLFLGHANVAFDGRPTLAFTNPEQEMVAVKPEVLARMLGAFSVARGGPLEVVFLNGCESEDLGKAVHAAGVPHVVCWRTLVETRAAAVFSTAFFDAAVKHNCDYAAAFEQAKLAVEAVPMQGKLDSTQSAFVPKYELRDPLAVPALSRGESWAAGVPVLLYPEPQPSWGRALLSPLLSPLLALLEESDLAAREAIARRFGKNRPPLALHDLGIQPGDQIWASVVIGYTRRVVWRTTVKSARCVTWDAMPSVDPIRYEKPYDGNVTFVLTHHGKRLLDEDNQLYYEFRRVADGGDGNGVGNGGRGVGDVGGGSGIGGGAIEGDSGRGGGAGPSVAARLLTRLVLLALTVGALWVAYRTVAVLLVHVLLPLVRSPLLAVYRALMALVTVILVRVAYRLFTEDGPVEGEAEAPS